MGRNGNRNNNTRSVRLDFGNNRLVIERNGTVSGDTHPFCAKSKSQTFLQDLCTHASVKDDEIFKGSVNHMVFITEAQAQAMLGHAITQIPAFQDRDDGDDDSSDNRHDQAITLAGDPGITNAGGGAPPDDGDLDDVNDDDDDDDDDDEDGDDGDGDELNSDLPL
jgi:hypothetical protein